MPDNKPSENIEEQPKKQSPEPQPVNPPLPPNAPDSSITKPVTTQEMKAEVKIIEDRVKRAERWMIGFTAAIALFGFCAVIVAVLQWSAMKGQLKEMKSGSVDTHALAVAGGKQADASKIQSEQAKAQTDKMKESLRETEDLIIATNNLARQAKRSADIAEKVFAITNRPYLGSDHFSMEYIEDGNTLVFRLYIKNFGTVPSERTDIHLLAMLNDQVLPRNIVDPGYGTLFPGIPVMRWGKISGKNLEGVKAGTISLRAKLWAFYYGPPENTKYSYCEEFRYWPNTQTWASLGTCEPPTGQNR